jgi:IclR family transcriptional regulator, pca regulon regulatory protein
MDVNKRQAVQNSKLSPLRVDSLMVQSVEKAFRVLAAFDGPTPTMGLTQLGTAVGLDKSTVQRFTHTLTKLGYLRKDPDTKRFELTVKTLDFGYLYTRANPLIHRALPYLLHLSKTTEETVNLTVQDDTDIIFVSRFMSRHVLNSDVIIGTRMPSYCTAPGIAILSQLPLEEARDTLERSDLKAFTPHTTYRMEDLLKKLEITAARGYATAFEEFFLGDLSIAAPILDQNRRPVGAINIAVSRARFSSVEAEKRFSPLVVTAALSISETSHSRR